MATSLQTELSASAKHQIVMMREGGKRLREVKQHLQEFTHVGVSFDDIETEAQRLIAERGAQPSFSTVPGYSWATCIMKNDELCHGIPEGKVVADGDVITIDVGLLHEGFHLDTTVSFGVGSIGGEAADFLAAGRKVLSKAIGRIKHGVSVFEVSSVIERELTRKGYGAVYQLTGHGIGKKLHDEPSIPCVAIKSDKRVILSAGQTIAVEVMYTQGSPHLVLDKDKWTYRTEDGSLSAMFEETVAVTAKGAEVLT